ncbi:MAG: L-aspartate oxidase [Clostridia bacterium]|nr:L-aspartate oxidase [Clostridia bacterium]
MKMIKTDILIVGSGCSGLYCALKCPSDKNILLISKSDLESSDSYLAQGGICMLKDDQDYESYFEDTMKAGHYENDKESVGIMIRSSQDVIRDLISYGTQFESDPEGQFLFTKEGAHSDKRILFHDDVTGQEITSHLLEEVKKRENVTLMEFTTMVDIVEKDNVCYGAVLRLKDGSLDVVDADYVVLACGGIGGLYEHSTNYSHLTGDALAIALRHNVALKNTNYVQIHPTTFYTEKNEERSFLISESVRGEGAVLLDKNMERFTDELQPRDLLSKAILEQMKKDGTKHVWEDLRPIPRDELFKHFPNIIKHCKEMGYDVTKEPIPVVPAQLYFMGGIQVDHASRTTMEQLYAVGETSNNGVHGRNRLASNSLLESLVFAKRAAVDIAEKYPAVKRDRASSRTSPSRSIPTRRSSAKSTNSPSS